jgi:ABC-type transport system substrate-binding protein
MDTKKIVVAIVAVALVFLMASSSAISPVSHISGLPKSDEILWKGYPGATPEVVVDEFLTGVTDWIGGPMRKDLYDEVIAAGHKVTELDPMAEWGFLALNCRDYKESSGEPNFPLNVSQFRVALTYIYGIDDRQDDIFGYVQAPWTYACPNCIPPAQEPFFDETVSMPNTDWAQAWTILQAEGFFVDGDNWLSHPDHGKLRDLHIVYPTGSTYVEQGPGLGFTTNFNEFITYIGAVGPIMDMTPTDFGTLVGELLVYRDYDIIVGIRLTNQGLYPDTLFSTLHSQNLPPGGWNWAGINDPEIDEWTEIIMTSLDVDEIINACSLISQKFCYELVPWIPGQTGARHCTVCRDERGELTGIVQMPNVGARDADLMWMSLKWKGEPGVAWPGGTIRTSLGDEPDTLNPYTDDTGYCWDMYDMALQGLRMLDPTTLLNVPCIATDWSLEPWTSIPEIGIDEGSTATYYIRQDVTWHDGEPLDAYDCVANMRVMREYKPGRYDNTWTNLAYEEADGPYKFNVYFYATCLFYLDYIDGTALLAPEHIILDIEQQVEDGILEEFLDWAPADNSYEDLTGEPPPEKYSFMTQVVGNGPYVFDYYDRSTATARAQRFEEFFVNAPVLGAVVGDWRIDPDTTYTYKGLVQNWGAVNATSEEGEHITVTVDAKIYEDDVLAHEENGITLDKWKFTNLGPYTTGTLSSGEHTIKIEIYEDGTLLHTYTHTFVATLREDVSTYEGLALDFKVNIGDIFAAAKAFGSSAEDAVEGNPAGLRWNPVADVNDDFKVNINDIFFIAKAFGWSG